MSVTGSRRPARKIFPLNAIELGQLTSTNALAYGAE